jgi:hypothetical protein
MDNAVMEKNADASIELCNGASWVRLSICLAEDYTGGSVARLAPEARTSLEPGDETSSSYTNRNWLSGVASGAFYAYRTLKVQRRVVVVTELTGRLCAPDIQVLAFAAARMIADHLQRELALEELAGWHVRVPETPAALTPSPK